MQASLVQVAFKRDTYTCQYAHTYDLGHEYKYACLLVQVAFEWEAGEVPSDGGKRSHGGRASSRTL